VTAEQRPVVVCGIDDSPGARAALAEAVHAAARRGGRVRAVAVYEPPDPYDAWGYGPTGGMPLPRVAIHQQSERQAAREMVAPVLDRLRAELPTMPSVDVDAIPGRPVEALVEVARGAAELVVGHRGLGPVGSMVMGSTSLGCVLHAPCPVTVVPAPVPA
jgi:nucleotide-binding universal stress UspA family protein